MSKFNSVLTTVNSVQINSLLLQNQELRTDLQNQELRTELASRQIDELESLNEDLRSERGELSELVSRYEASEAGDNTMEDIADEEAIETGEDDKQFDDEQRNLMIEEVSSYIRTIEEKTETVKNLQKEVQVLQNQHENTNTSYRKLAAVRNELHEAKLLIKQLKSKIEADRFTKNRMLKNMKAEHEADKLKEGMTQHIERSHIQNVG